MGGILLMSVMLEHITRDMENYNPNPRSSCKYCVGSIYCCVHADIDNSQYSGYPRIAQLNHDTNRRIVCVRGRGCNCGGDRMEGS